MKLLLGDCIKSLRTMESDSFDSLVTDPPAGIGFMGKEWDHHKGGRDQWVAWMAEVMRECLRVLKPGAHGLVWALPRTSHWTATALEDAGFEIRDVCTHLFGSGFPKSLDVSKAIDKAAGAEREVIGPSARHGGGANSKYAQDEWTKANAATMGMVITAPATDAAKQWQGFGTALKPASEHWILVRKPCSEKTVAANVLKWGTGALNIDASRIGTEQIESGRSGRSECESSAFGKKLMATDKAYSTGRFPANLVLSHSPYCEESQCDIECAVKQLDEQSGQLAGCGNKRTRSAHADSKSKFGMGGGEPTVIYDRGGGASRFFYVAKASKADKNAGLEGVNGHPTVKPQKLMTYLIRMVTPPGGHCLDPFMGSGSTGCAAVKDGFHFTGVEREPDYFEIAEKRISHAAVIV